MISKVAHAAILVRDYDEAIRFYCGILGFTLKEDSKISNKRWVRIGLSGPNHGSDLILSQAANDIQAASVGKQAGGRVFLYLYTDQLEAEVLRLQASGVHFLETIRDEPYGKIAVFEDLYGNRIDLIEPKDK